jgi:HD-GYP domain-containing protein (c-di-GMP phosphodiesterase class II)
MQTHTLIGPRILSRITGLHSLLPIIELHHENFDGSGYPYGLRGDQTPLIARIVRVADAFDAMTTNRVYRPALSRERALLHLQEGTGTLFDPNVVSAMETILGVRHAADISAGGDAHLEELENLVYATS